VPFVIQNQSSEISQMKRIQSSIQHEQFPAQFGANYNLWKKKLLEKQDDLDVKAEAIAQSVLSCLKSETKPEDLSTYLNGAN
jgi:hypothetical protein